MRDFEGHSPASVPETVEGALAGGRSVVAWTERTLKPALGITVFVTSL